MAINSTTPRTRRAVIGAALGGAAAVAATSLAAPLAARAATDGNVILGQGDSAGENEADAGTIVKNTTAGAGNVSLTGQHADAGTGVKGESVTGPGVVGVSTDTTPTDDFTVASTKTGLWGAAGDASTAISNTDEAGVFGFADLSANSRGVMGQSVNGTGVVGLGDTGLLGIGFWGVYGTGQMGVVGDVDVDATGVYGFTGPVPAPEAPGGIGVYAAAASTSQVALSVSGKVKFSRSGRRAIRSTASTLKVPMTGCTTASYVIATLQDSVSGLYIRGVHCSTGYFTVYLSKAPGKTVYVGYLVIN